MMLKNAVVLVLEQNNKLEHFFLIFPNFNPKDLIENLVEYFPR